MAFDARVKCPERIASLDSHRGLPLVAIVARPCVVPNLEREELDTITAICRLIHRRRIHRGKWQPLPYSFRYPQGAGVDPTGEMLLGDGVGLTCSTLVLAVFETAKIPYLDPSGWVERPGDKSKQQELLKAMREGIPGFAPPAAPVHIAKVEAELPCIRIRPEEVASAGMTDHRPIDYERAERYGRWIIERLTPESERACI